MWILLISRFLQGFSAAIVFTVGFALLIDTVGSKVIGQWMGYVIACMSVGMTISPFIGGILYEKVGYLSLFVVMFALIALDILMRIVMVEKKVALKPQPPRKFRDYGTLSLNIDQAICEQPKLNPEGVFDPDAEPRKPTIPLLGPASIHPIRRNVPLIVLLTSPRVLTSIYGVVISTVTLTSFDSVLPIFVERTFGLRSIGGGLVFLPITIPVLAAPLAGKLADTMDIRWTASGFISAAFFITSLILIDHDDIKQMVLLLALLALYGLRSFHIPDLLFRILTIG